MGPSSLPQELLISVQYSSTLWKLLRFIRCVSTRWEKAAMYHSLQPLVATTTRSWPIMMRDSLSKPPVFMFHWVVSHLVFIAVSTSCGSTFYLHKKISFVVLLTATLWNAGLMPLSALDPSDPRFKLRGRRTTVHFCTVDLALYSFTYL